MATPVLTAPQAQELVRKVLRTIAPAQRSGTARTSRTPRTSAGTVMPERLRPPEPPRPGTPRGAARRGSPSREPGR
jgi:hypothetical protein